MTHPSRGKLEGMLASLTGLGLSAAAGLNAYIPLLLVGVLARFTDVITLPEPYRWIQSGWAIGIVSVLLVAELILDKVAVVDHVNDVLQTVVRPTAGGLAFSASDYFAWSHRKITASARTSRSRLSIARASSSV